MTKTAQREGKLGGCTEADLVELDRAVADMAVAATEHEQSRERVGRILAELIAKGAMRQALADRAGFDSYQTVTNMAFGRPRKKET